MDNVVLLHEYTSICPELAKAFCACYIVFMEFFDPRVKQRKFVDESQEETKVKLQVCMTCTAL